MRYKKFGSTNIEIPVVGQGTMGIGGFFDEDLSSDQTAIHAIKIGIDLGMTLIDTAEVYGNGHSEEIVGKAVEKIRNEVIIATKVSPEHLRYDDVISSCEESLKRLRTDYIDLYQIHWPNPGIPMKESFEAMMKLRDEGKIRFIGVSNFTLCDLQEIMSISDVCNIVSVQTEYNLFDRTAEQNAIPYCEENNLTILAYSPLNQGEFYQNSIREEVLTNVAKKHQKTNSQIALNWLISQTNIVVIPKAIKNEHIVQNAAASDFTLDMNDIEEIDRVFQSKPIDVPLDNIKIIVDESGRRKVYETIEDALQNPLGFIPSPSVLADHLKRTGEMLKPVRVKKSSDPTGSYKFELVEGRIRYWAWYIAYNGKKPIPVLVRS